MSVEILSALAEPLFIEGGRAELLAEGFKFIEGPIWRHVEQTLYFNDIVGDAGYKWTQAAGLEKIRAPNNKANGMANAPDGSILICEHATSRVVRQDSKGERSVIASHWGDEELNSPNDIIVKADGTIYFSDPSFGRFEGFGVAREQELPFQGLFRIAPDRVLHLESQDFEQPNGVCLSPDERVLYVNDTRRAHIKSFAVRPDGSLGPASIFAHNIGDGVFKNGTVDGMKCDAIGNVYVTGPKGIWIFSPERDLIARIGLPEHVANFCWGGQHGKELFCACSTSLYRFPLAIAGSLTSTFSSQA